MNSNNPLVSIVIPAYNHARYLREAIISVLDQTYPHIELIVLNDGSTDETDNILKEYSDKFYWESQPNMGQSRTLNKGWVMAKGELLSYLSADDILLPDAVCEAVKCLHENPDAVLVYGDFKLIDPSSSTIRTVITQDFDYKKMLAEVICQPGPGVMFRKSAFEAAGLWDSELRQMPDYEYWLRLGLSGDFVRIPKVLACFRIHDSSQSFSQTSVERSDEPVRIIQKYFDSTDIPNELSLLRNRALGSAFMVSSQLHIRSGRYTKGFYYFWQSLLLYPPNILKINMGRRILNAFFNRIGHRLLWQFKALLK